MGTYFKALNDHDEAMLLYNQVKILLGFIWRWTASSPGKGYGTR